MTARYVHAKSDYCYTYGPLCGHGAHARSRTSYRTHVARTNTRTTRDGTRLAHDHRGVSKRRLRVATYLHTVAVAAAGVLLGFFNHIFPMSMSQRGGWNRKTPLDNIIEITMVNCVILCSIICTNASARPRSNSRHSCASHVASACSRNANSEL